MRPDELERRLQEHLDGLSPALRAELIHVPMLPDFDRANALGDTPTAACERRCAARRPDRHLIWSGV